MTTNAPLHITGLLLGGFLSVIFIGYMILSFSEGRSETGLGAPRRFAGIFALILGAVMFEAWAYLIWTGWGSFSAQAGAMWVHVFTELVSAVSLIIAGVGMLRGWSRGPALFMLANGFLLFSTLLALAAYGNQGHPFLMNGITILLTIASVYVVGLVYGWEHFVLRLDQPDVDEKNKAA